MHAEKETMEGNRKPGAAVRRGSAHIALGMNSGYHGVYNSTKTLGLFFLITMHIFIWNCESFMVMF